MTRYFLVSADTREVLQLGEAVLARGGEADIYRVPGFSSRVAKIFHRRGSSPREQREKLEAMIARPPEPSSVCHGAIDLPVFAWPTNLIEDESGACVGYLMREMPGDRAIPLHFYMSRWSAQRKFSPDDRSLPRRVHVCRNLAAASAELHRQQHYFVDIKPQNIFMFKGTGVVCLVDNDSFSIAGLNDGPRFPASAYSSEYLAPELLRNGMGANSVVDDTQDRFALAVLLFEILNHGLHPFQGVPTMECEDWNIDMCIKRGYYPYGLIPHPVVSPSVRSVHDCLDTGTRCLFDGAFAGERPSAEEWRDHFDQLMETSGSFGRCEIKPNDALHIHLAGMPCMECRMQDLIL